MFAVVMSIDVERYRHQTGLSGDVPDRNRHERVITDKRTDSEHVNHLSLDRGLDKRQTHLLVRVKGLPRASSAADMRRTYC